MFSRYPIVAACSAAQLLQPDNARLLREEAPHAYRILTTKVPLPPRLVSNKLMRSSVPYLARERCRGTEGGVLFGGGYTGYHTTSRRVAVGVFEWQPQRQGVDVPVSG